MRNLLGECTGPCPMRAVGHMTHTAPLVGTDGTVDDAIFHYIPWYKMGLDRWI